MFSASNYPWLPCWPFFNKKAAAIDRRGSQPGETGQRGDANFSSKLGEGKLCD